MKRLNKGNVYNVETAEISTDRSKEISDVSNIMIDQFWESMKRQNITPELAKQIAKHTFREESDIK